MDQPQVFHFTEKVLINGIETDIVCHKFQNRVFLIITQLQKLTNIYLVKNQTNSGISNQKIFSIQHKFGAISDEIEAGIRFILNNMQNNNEIVISLGIPDMNKTVLKEIKDVLQKISVI